ncbi:MAG: hypothetical protein H6779_04445 [Candidatus Nomurabacteria bacterium]|nr:MAG: hypothetical protein H6779_04445 [Candidatus Nomurabacteria bacterium]
MTHSTYNSTRSMLIVGSIVTLGMLALTNPAAAYYNHHMPSSNDISVSSENNATVVNEVMVGANTGYNGILGGNTGRAGNGGDATGNRANGGNGGDTGESNNGGSIFTGAAGAIGTVDNTVNSNRTVVTTDCGCENRKGGSDITVWSGNNATLLNGLGVDANTGDNMIAGGTSGAAGNGGDATSYTRAMWFKHMHKGGAANAGNGGNSGASNNGGDIMTGPSVADGLVINVVNRNVTRVAR